MKSQKKPAIPQNVFFKNEELPEGWHLEKLGKIATRITKGATPTSYGYKFQKTGIKFVKIENITNGQISESSIKQFISSEANENQKRSILESGDILFSIAGTIGNVCLVKEENLPANTNQAIAIIRVTSHVFDPKFLQFFLKSKLALDQVTTKARGGAMNNVSLDDVRDIIIPLPPLAEQRRIVTRVEALQSHVNIAHDGLKRLPLIMKRFRQSVLASAWSGRLTDGWRERNLDTVPSYQEFNIQELLSESMINGKSVSDDINGFPVLRLSAVKKGRIDITDRKCGGWSRADASRFLINLGDFFVVRGNGSLNLVGRGGLVDNNSDPVAFPDTLIRLRFKKELILSEWLALIWDSPPVRDQIEQLAHTTAGIHKISQKDISKITVIVPPLAEQFEIVRRVDALFERVDAIERDIAASTKRTEALVQVVLGKAFRGELVAYETETCQVD